MRLLIQTHTLGVLNWTIRISPTPAMGLFVKQILCRTMTESNLQHTALIAGLGHSVLNHNTGILFGKQKDYLNSICNCRRKCVKFNDYFFLRIL